MRITCDANILVRAAVRPRGPARAVLEFATQLPHQLVLSPHILTEVRRALGYDRIRLRYGLTDEEIAEYVALLDTLADLITTPPDVPAVSPDHDDDAIIATAVAGSADVLCTLDRHLRLPIVQAYCATYAIRVMTDVELLTELRTANAAPAGPAPKPD